MKTQKLKLDIPSGFEFASFDKESSEVILKQSDAPMQRIKTIDDILADHNLSKQQFETQCQGLSEDEVAYRIIKMLVQSLNEGWIPDWSDQNQYKYFPWFEMRGSSGFRFDDCAYWLSNSYVGSRLALKSRELATYAGTQFTKIFEQFMIIN
ncbi:MAG: hypothetical protein WDO15_11285 [Bacteroidota bacterium]